MPNQRYWNETKTIIINYRNLKDATACNMKAYRSQWVMITRHTPYAAYMRSVQCSKAHQYACTCFWNWKKEMNSFLVWVHFISIFFFVLFFHFFTIFDVCDEYAPLCIYSTVHTARTHTHQVHIVYKIILSIYFVMHCIQRLWHKPGAFCLFVCTRFEHLNDWANEKNNNKNVLMKKEKKKKWNQKIGVRFPKPTG